MEENEDIEQIDVVDENDNYIRTIDRATYYAECLKYNRFVNIFVANSKGELLVPKRKLSKSLYPGCYDFSCGEHVQAGETYIQAAERGIMEELVMGPERLKSLGTLLPRDGVSNPMEVFLVQLDAKDKVETDEFESLHWMELGELEKLVDSAPDTFKPDMAVVLRVLGERISEELAKSK